MNGPLIDNRMLLEGQRDLLDAFIQVMADAIDKKSPYTGGHGKRVPALTEMFAEAACAATSGPFKDFDLSEEEHYELHIAAWLHDCGKVTTPDHIVDKPTKLSTLYDRIDAVKQEPRPDPGDGTRPVPALRLGRRARLRLAERAGVRGIHRPDQAAALRERHLGRRDGAAGSGVPPLFTACRNCR